MHPFGKITNAFVLACGIAAFNPLTVFALSGHPMEEARLHKKWRAAQIEKDYRNYILDRIGREDPYHPESIFQDKAFLKEHPACTPPSNRKSLDAWADHDLRLACRFQYGNS